MIPADLTRTIRIPADELEAGMLVVDWHDERGRSVFNSDPQARRIVELSKDSEEVHVVLEDRHARAYLVSAMVEVQK